MNYNHGSHHILIYHKRWYSLYNVDVIEWYYDWSSISISDIATTVVLGMCSMWVFNFQHEKGDSSDPAHFTSICILACLGKIIVNIIHGQLHAYHRWKDILSSNHFSLRKGYSTHTCFVFFVDFIFQGTNREVSCGLLFLDLCNAVDTEDYTAVIKQCHPFHLKSSTPSWVKLYLNSTSKITEMSDSTWISCPLLRGVSQGSYLEMLPSMAGIHFLC